MNIGLEINIEEIDRHVILRLVGEITESTYAILETKINVLLKEGHKKICLDFSKIENINRAGIRSLLAFSKKVELEKGRIVIFSVPEEISDLFEISHVKNSLKICRNQKEAFLEKA